MTVERDAINRRSRRFSPQQGRSAKSEVNSPSFAMGGQNIGSIRGEELNVGCPGAECMVVDRESRIVYRNRHTFAYAGHSTSPANSCRHQKSRTRWDALESAMGPDYREGSAARNAFFAGPPGRASILPPILRDGRNRQTHVLGLLLPGASSS